MYLKNCSYCLFFILFFGVVLTLGLNRNEAEKPSPPSQALVQPPVVATTPACARPRWRVSLKMMVCAVCVAQSFGCSLSWSRKVDLPSALWQESRLNFKGLPKLSGVITNHWVFLRCDWSPVFSWFYYQSKAKKKRVFFPNLMWMVKKSWFLSPEVWLRVGKVLGIPQRLSKDSPLFW